MLGCLFPVGIYAHLILTDVTDTDLIVPSLVNDASVFPFWATDFLVVSILAAAMSSMDSVLLVAASTLYKNIVAPFRPSSGELLWTRTAVIGFSIVAALLALKPPGDIVEITIFSGSLYAVCFFPAVVFGLYWQRGSPRTVLWSMAVGISCCSSGLLLGCGRSFMRSFPPCCSPRSPTTCSREQKRHSKSPRGPDANRGPLLAYDGAKRKAATLPRG